jgi:hypothetical protein
MLRLYDARTGRLEELPRTRLLRVRVAGADLRSHVLGDVIRRLAERHGRQVLLTAPRDLIELNVPPSDEDTAGAADLYLGEGPGRLMAVGPSTAEPSPSRLAEQGLDPLSLRLAILERPYREPLELDARSVEAADRELRRMRQNVAQWAEEPSKPMRAEVRAGVLEALDADLDTPGALRLLRHLASAEVTAGSKFETYAYVDMVLALDLVRDVGRSRPLTP